MHAGLTWLPIRKLKLSGMASIDKRQYHQQYVNTLSGRNENLYLVGAIDHRSTSFKFRGELFLTPELSLQYYGSPYYSVGDYSDFRGVDKAISKEIDNRLDPLDVQFDEVLNPASAFPAACGGVSERKNINNKRIDDSSPLAARRFNACFLFYIGDI